MEKIDGELEAWARTAYDELALDELPQALRRESNQYYYLSIYPGLRHMRPIEDIGRPVAPDTITTAYIHTPFCSGICDFCSYLVHPAGATPDETISNYLGLVTTQADQLAESSNLGLSYLYFGGGTPSLIPVRALEGLLGHFDNRSYLQASRYGTIELHPEFFNDLERARDFLGVLKDYGIGRVSIGYQSSDDNLLEATNRRHASDFLASSVEFLRNNGMLVNIDLMYGMPDQSLHDWNQTLHDAITVQPDSVTPYFLFVDKGTVTARQVERGDLILPSHRHVQTQHIMGQKALEAAGYYELPSDFFGRLNGDPNTFTQEALPSESVSVPLGAGGYGYYDETQFCNFFNLRAYRARIEAGESAIWRGYRFTGNEGFHRDIMFSFKNSPYISRDLCQARYGIDPLEYFQEQFVVLSAHELVTIDDSTIRLTQKGRLVVEEIACMFAIEALDDGAATANRQDKGLLIKHHFAPTYGKASV